MTMCALADQKGDRKIKVDVAYKRTRAPDGQRRIDGTIKILDQSTSEVVCQVQSDMTGRTKKIYFEF